MTKPVLIALHEVRIYLRDKGDLAFSLLLPVITFALLYGAFGGQDAFHGTAYVVNEDEGGAYSALLVDRLDAQDNLDVTLLSSSEADAKLDRADLLLVFYIPYGFSDELAEGDQAELVIKQRGNGGDDGQIVASIARSVVEDLAQEFHVRAQVAEAVEGQGISDEQVAATADYFIAQQHEDPTVYVREETFGGGSTDPLEIFLPSILTMYVLFAVTLTARAIVEERRNGTLERLMTTRLEVKQLFFGKFFAFCARGLVQTLILMLLAYAVFQMFTPASFFQSLVIVVVFLAAVSGLGLIIASVARTEDQAVWIAIVFTMVMVILGGTFFELPESGVLATLSNISVNTYVNEALKAVISEGRSLANVGMQLAVLAGVAVVSLVVSRFLFKVLPGGR
jgi:ABC-2 type transport system permease protein